jgi:ATP-dependent DNA helicase RecG
MDEIALRTLILRGEDTTLEFKSKAKVNDIHDLAAEGVAFLNKRGGTLLLGVEDDGAISGFESSEIESCNQKLRSIAKDQISPPIFIDTSNILTSAGIVIAIQLDEGIDKPYQTTKGGAFYIRNGDEKRHISHRDELRRLFQIGSHVYAEKQVLKGTRLDQFDFPRYRQYYQDRFSEEAPEDDALLIHQLESLHLLSGPELSLAGCLLFAKAPQHQLPKFHIRHVWFKGSDIAVEEFRSDRLIEGDLATMYRHAYDLLDAWNLREQPPESNFNTPGKPVIPPAVFVEILTNALIHRDYFISDSIKIFIFDDRIEISSPGTLPNSLTLAEATQGISRSRNPIIEKIGLTVMQYKGIGSGLKRATQLYPKIHFNNDHERNAFIVTLPY